MPQRDFGTGGLAYLAAWRENRFAGVRRGREGSAARFHAKAQSTQCRKRDFGTGGLAYLAAWRENRFAGLRRGREGSAARFHAKAQSTQCRKEILGLAAWRTWRPGVRTDSSGFGGGGRARRLGFTQRRKVRNAAKRFWDWRLGVLGGVRSDLQISTDQYRGRGGARRISHRNPEPSSSSSSRKT